MRVAPTVLIALLLATAGAEGARPDFWRLRSADEYLAGESEGLTVSSRGRILPGPALTRAVSLPDPFVLSQTVDPSGALYLGTGNSGNVYRVRGTESTLLHQASEPEIYAIAWHRGAVYAGSSPYGKIYRIDPADGSVSVFFDPQEAYIWAIEPLSDGSLAVGTGVEGRIWKVGPDGKGEVLYDAPETHIRVLAVGGGRILAGGAAEGRIYEIDAEGRGRALFDSDFTEISSIWIDPAGGAAWAAGVSSTLPTAAPPKPEQPPQPRQTESRQQSGQPQGGTASSAPTPAVDISFSFDQPVTTAGGGSAELYRIDPDGYVTAVRKLEREMIYDIAGADGAILLGTGPLGRIYRWLDGELALLATVPEKQVVSLVAAGGSTVATTTNAGAVYRLAAGGRGRAEYRSAVKDTGRFSTFGSYSLEGSALDGAVNAFRSGNTNAPDETWSDWFPAKGRSGRIDAPPARFLQWRLTVESPPPGFAVDSMSASFMNRNASPVIESLTVLEPGVVFVGASFPAAPQVLEATNPDEHGIFSSLDDPRERSDPGKRLFRKGYRTVNWKASDPNGDPLRFSLSFRPVGGKEWLRLRDNVEESQYNFDTSQLPDGRYELRLVASDERENPERPLTASTEGVEFTIDNTPPAIVSRIEGEWVVVTVRDALSPLVRAEYAADAERWIRIPPVDGIVDSREEEFRFRRSEIRDQFVVLRVVDSSWNVATATIRP
ncbi:MAG TPA: hypothetical protein VMS56_03785 [Thermoanaerobaculia bacterium]|nr:hypothetical protein [Thermoanaerobaculia bacterium]